VSHCGGFLLKEAARDDSFLLELLTVKFNNLYPTILHDATSGYLNLD
jgi:hypothetical protein